MICELCTKEISDKELKSAKEGTAFKFYDNIRKKDVAYHPACYDEKWRRETKPPTPEFTPKNI